jgi:cytoskeletal protein RodZ
MRKDNINIQIEQQKKLKQIGTQLQAIRLEQGISLETIASETMIPVRLLKAIEAGDLQELPEPCYTKALIKKFARTIDAEELDLDFTAIALAKSVVKRKFFLAKPFLSFQLRSTHLYLLYIVLIGISVGAIATLVENPTIVQNPQVEETIPENTAIAIENTNQTERSLSISQLVSKSNNSKSVVVNIALKDRCWLKVMVDGKTDFEGILPKGTHRTWTGNEQITLRAGNAGGVVVTFNDGQKKILGEPGQVQEVTYKNGEI